MRQITATYAATPADRDIVPVPERFRFAVVSVVPAMVFPVLAPRTR